MRICFFAPAGNYHTQKWSKWFCERGHEVHVVSFDDANIAGVHVHSLNSKVSTAGTDCQKLQYFLSVRKLRSLIKQISPDILSVHYASSYGSIAAVSGVHPYFLSVWGSDIYEFPRKSVVHKALLSFSLRNADYLLSTSRAMAEEAKLYTDKKFYITPFGVDISLFSPEKRSRTDYDFIIGTAKSLSPKYGIDYLIRATAIVKKEHPEIPLKLRIAGKGSHENEYKALVETLGLADITTWLGFISPEQVAEEWANMDLAVVFSSSESFGVSAVEAQACGVPVVISDVPGLTEATCPGKTSIVVPEYDENALANTFVKLYFNRLLRESMSKCGPVFVKDRYELNKCFEQIEDIFESSL